MEAALNMPGTSPYDTNKRFLLGLLEAYGRLVERRPKRLYESVVKLLAPPDARRIVVTADGAKLFINPFNDLGRSLLTTGSYEEASAEILRRHVKPGDAVIDVGANEGVFTVLMGRLAGPSGKVVAIEPQSRLHDILEINCRLNGVDAVIYPNALGPSDGATGELMLYSGINSGMSSFVRRYHSTVGTERVSFVSLPRVMADCRLDRIDFMKVDTEGFEAEIVDAILPDIAAGRVRQLYLDYHAAILAGRGVRTQDIHAKLTGAGMRSLSEPGPDASGYVLYLAD